MSDIIYRQRELKRFRLLDDYIRTSKVWAYGNDYEYTRTTFGAYNEDDERVTGWGGEITVTTGVNNIENLDKIKNFLEKNNIPVEMELTQDDNNAELRVHTCTCEDDIEKAENYIFYAFAYLDEV